MSSEKQKNIGGQMKVLRIDNQNCCEPIVFDNLEKLKEQLIDFHSIDYDNHFVEGEEYKSIKDFTLENILSWGDWSYEWITNEEAKQYE